MVEVFFLTVASGSQIKTVERLNYPYVLVNFMTKTNTPPKCAKVLFVDSGGFGTIYAHGRYKKTDLQYLAYVKKHKPRYFALRDYCCEPEVLRKWNRTVRQHIHMTLDHHLRLLDLVEKISVESQPVPVLQGWELDDYLYCLDLFREHGLINGRFDLLGLGTICRKVNLKSCKSILLRLREEIPSKIKLHGFGVKLSFLKDLAVWNALYSVDTVAYDFISRWKVLRGGADKKDASEKSARNYLSKIDALRQKFGSQKRLEVFCDV